MPITLEFIQRGTVAPPPHLVIIYGYRVSVWDGEALKMKNDGGCTTIGMY